MPGYLRRNHGHLDFLGVLDHGRMVQAFHDCDVVVAPSRIDNFPLVCAEAGACGRPVVGARDTGMKSIITHGETGYLEDTKRPETFASRLVELIKNPDLRRSMGNMARRRVVECFGLEVVAGRNRQVYQQVIDRFAWDKKAKS